MNATVPILRSLRPILAATVAATALLAPLGTAGAVSEATRPAVEVQSVSGAYLAAKAAQSGGELDIATEYFDRALEIDPDSALLQQEAMFAFFADGRFEDGVALAAELKDDVDAGKVAHIALGIDALRKDRPDEAIELFGIEDTSELDQLLVVHLSAWAEAEAGRFEDATGRIDAITGPAWFTIFNLYQKGMIAALKGDEVEARRLLQALLSDSASVQTSPDAYLAAVEALAQIEARAGETEKAIETVDLGLDLAPTYDPLVALRDEIVSLSDASPERVREIVDAPVSSARGGAAEALYILGQGINRGDGQQVALLYFQFAEAVADETSPKLLTALAGTAQRASRVDRAIQYYERVPEDSPYRRTAELQMGLDLWYADRKEEARTHLRAAVERYPDDLQAHLAYADVLSADKNYAEAARVLERALEIAPEDGAANWNIYYQRGIAYERMKEWDKAEPNFKRALELSPDQPQVLNYLGYSWVDMNRNLDEGLEMIRTAVDLRPNDGYIIDSLGWAYYRLGRFDEAVEQLERAVLISPSEPTLNDHLGDAYWRVGRQREARFQWERALTGAPEPEPEVAARIREKLQDGLGPVGSDLASDDAEPASAATSDDRASNTKGSGETGALPN